MEAKPRTKRRSCRPLDQGRNDRCVVTTVSGPPGASIPATTATRGSSATKVGSSAPGHRYGVRPGIGGRRITSQVVTGYLLSNATPYAGPPGPTSPSPSAATHCSGVPRSAGTNR